MEYPTARILLVYDPASSEITTVSTSAIETGRSKWKGAVALDGILYAVPYAASCILIYDTSTKQICSKNVSAFGIGDNKWQAAVVVDNKVFGIPFSADCILVYDVATSDVSAIDISNVAVGASKWLGATVLGKTIYAAPCHNPNVLVYNTLTGEMRSIDTTGKTSGIGGQYGFAGIAVLEHQRRQQQTTLENRPGQQAHMGGVDEELLRKGPIEALVLKHFAEFDRDNNGYIDSSELAAVLEHVDGAAWDSARIGSLFDVIDRNGDGCINYSELVDWLYTAVDEGNPLRLALGAIERKQCSDGCRGKSP